MAIARKIGLWTLLVILSAFLIILFLYHSYKQPISSFKMKSVGLREMNSKLREENAEIIDSICLRDNTIACSGANEIRVNCDDFFYYVDSLKRSLVSAAGGSDSNGEILRPYDIDIANKLLVEGVAGKTLFKKRKHLEETLKKIVDSDSVRYKISALFNDSLMTGQGSAQEQYFNHIPVIAAITILNKFQNDCQHSERYALADITKRGK